MTTNTLENNPKGDGGGVCLKLIYRFHERELYRYYNMVYNNFTRVYDDIVYLQGLLYKIYCNYTDDGDKEIRERERREEDEIF